MSRLLLLCLLVSTHAYTKDFPPHLLSTPNLPLFSNFLIDTIPPTIECPPDDTITLGTGECGIFINYTVTASDDQPGFLLVQISGLASGSEFPVGTTLNAFVVNDQEGNTAACSFTVTVKEASIVLICDNLVELELGPNCFASIQPEEVLLSPYGCPDDYVVQVDKTPPFGNGPWVPANLGQADIGKTYAYRVIDGSTGNNCFASVHILDSAPTISCEDIVVHCAVNDLDPAFLVDSLGIAAGMPVVDENCPGYTLTHIDFASDLPCDPMTGISGTVNRIWTVTDASGNSATCQQTIFRERTFIGIQFPPDNTVSCSEIDNIALAGAPVLVVGNQEFNLWPASFCEMDLNYNDSPLSAGCGGSGQILRTWEIFDLCQPPSANNPLVGTQVIDVVDVNGPVLECDSSVTVSTDATNCRGAVDLPDVGLTDDCSPIVSIAAYWMADGLPDTLVGTLTMPDTLGVLDTVPDFPAGTTTIVHYVATDTCGNTGTCDISITVWDMDPPTTGCIPFVTVVLSPDGHFTMGADTLDINSADSCGQELWFKMRRTLANSCQPNVQFYDEVLFCCADIGDTIELTRRVYDVVVPDGPVNPDFGAGQFSDCTVRVEVLDTLAIGCTAPPDVVVGCTEFDPQFSNYGTAVSNCSVDSMAVSVDYAEYDSVCQQGTITRTFMVFGANGDSSACFQQLTVNHVQDYYIKFPDDLVVTMCDSTAQYGEPTFLTNGCEKLVATFEDEFFDVVPDACFKIERTWTIYNTCTYDSLLPPIVVPNPTPNASTNHPDNLPGPIVMPDTTIGTWSPTVVAITPGQIPTNFSVFWSATANAYRYKQMIKVIDQEKPVIHDCPSATLAFGDTSSNDPMLWNETYWLDNITNLTDMADGPVSLSITASDLCSGADVNVSFLLFLDLDNDGDMETVVDSENAPAPGTVNFDNANNPNYTGGEPRVFDGRSVPANELYRWAVHQSVDSSNQRMASVQWKTFAQMPTPGNPLGLPGVEPQLPYGTHKIQWFVADGCGNVTDCEYTFTIEDVAVPTVICSDSMGVEMPPSQVLNLSLGDFLQNASDNHTPPGQLELAVRKAGTGVGFPANGDTSLMYVCDDLGLHVVEVWAKDLAGNTEFCTVIISVNDADSSCVNMPITVAGRLETETGDTVTTAEVDIAATHAVFPPVNLSTQTDPQGKFAFSQAIPAGSTYTLTPSKDINPLNGVSTFDILLITKHILGLTPLGSPYKIIAADANRSNSVTTFDVVEIRKLILGIYNDFPANTSWRFVDKDFVFANPDNPFQSPFPESIMRTDVLTDQLADDFIGIKVGDVNNNADGDSLFSADDRTSGTLFFHLEDRSVQRGEEFAVRFKADEPVLGYQFTLSAEDLDIVEVSPGEGISPDNFAVHPDALTASVESGAGEFEVVFRARKAGQLSELLHASSRITRAEAYQQQENNGIALLDVGLLFDNRLISKVGFELYQNQPNPFDGSTFIGFHLPEASGATLTVFDETGRVLYSKSGHYPQGYNGFWLEGNLPGGEGVLLYRLETPTDSSVRKMVRVR